MLRICRKCELEKDLEEFMTNKECHFGRTYTCKICYHARSRKNYLLNKDKVLLRSSENYKKNRVRRMQKCRIRALQRYYDLSLEEYNTILKDQGGVCKICKSPRGDKTRNAFHVDHCHISGTIRGILCGNCNRGLGSFRDSKEFLLEAIEYLEDNGQQVENIRKKTRND